MHFQIMVLAFSFVWLVCTHTAFATGDCNNDNKVTIDEVQSAINMFLGLKTPLNCVDENRSNSVTIDEVQKTINTFLGLIVPASTVSSTVSGTAIISLVQASTSVKLDGAAVEIVAYDKADKELGRAAVSTDSTGGFAAQVPLIVTGGYVVITVCKEGFTQYQKRIDYTSPGAIELQADVEQIAFTKEIPIDATGAVVGKSSEPSFNFAFIRYANGTKKAVAGKAAILAAKSAADATLEMGISIPASSLSGVTSINAKASTFDPATNTLPGSYTATDSSGKEGKMVSLAFDYLDITANTAEGTKNLGKVATALVKSGVTKAAVKATTYTRSIYQSSCDNLFLEDYNTVDAGWQVPVWSLNPGTGKWVFIGEGTVSDSAGAVIATPTVASCKTSNYYLTIMVANTEFQNNYWNLDHIVFDTPTKVCLKGTFSAGATPLANMGLSMYGSNFDSSWGYTDATGAYNLETVLLSKNNTSRSATLYFYDADGVYNSQAVTLDAVYPACTTFDKRDFQIPCTVSGKLVDDTGNGVAYRSLQLSGTTFYKGVGTDSTGAFSSKVKCGESIGIYSGRTAPLATFNVNGSVENGEDTDDARAAVLFNVIAPNMAPSGYAYFASSSINVLKMPVLTAYVSGYDGDNNYPLTYKLTIGTTVMSGTIAASDPQPIEVRIPGLTAGTYDATYELTDSKGASSSMVLGKVYVVSGNRAPVTQLYASTGYIKTCSADRAVTLYGSAYDSDGDAMTGTWSLDSGVAPACSGGTATAGSSLYVQCQSALPQGNGPYVYRFTVSDSLATGESTTTVKTYNNAPVVTLKANKPLVATGSTGVDRIVVLTATATDPDADTLISGTWSVGGSPLTSCTGLTCSYTIPDTATVEQLFIFKYEAADCAATGSSTVQVVYGQYSDVNIIIQ